MTENKRRPFSPLRYLEYLLLRLLAFLINLFPVTWSTWLAHRAGDVIFFLIPSRKKIALANLEIAYGSFLTAERKEKIAVEGIRNFAVSLLEFFRIPSTLKEAKDCFEFEGLDHLEQAFAKKRGVIFVVSHLGSWEYLEFLFYLTGYACSVIVRNTRNLYIFSWIQSLRRKTTVNPLPKKGSIRTVLSELRKNNLVAVLIDQFDREGLPVPFFGHPAWTTALPARLARKTGAALVPGYCLRTAPGKYKFIIRPEVPLAEGENWEFKTTKKLNELFEKEISQCPEQWIWTHRRWKEFKKI